MSKIFHVLTIEFNTSQTSRKAWTGSAMPSLTLSFEMGKSRYKIEIHHVMLVQIFY